jgi:hypothetical protein
MATVRISETSTIQSHHPKAGSTSLALYALGYVPTKHFKRTRNKGEPSFEPTLLVKISSNIIMEEEGVEAIVAYSKVLS